MSYLQMSSTTTTTTTLTNISPNSARRVRTDLKTSENVYLTTNFIGPTRSRTSSPINIKLRPHQSTQTSCSSTPQHQHGSYLQGRSNTHDKISDCSIKSNQHIATVATTTTTPSKSKRIPCKSTNIPMAITTTSTTVANTRKYLKRSNFILTAAKHVVDDSRILSTSAPHEGSSYLSAHLPARATRLLNRSRMQQHCTLNNDNDSDSTKSPLTARRRTNTASSRTSTASSTTNNHNNSNSNNSANSSLQRKFSHHHHHHNHHQTSSSFHQRDTHSSSDDLMLYDKSFRNAMIQDVLQFKKQLLRLRKILQENENCLTRTETLNPFENDNGQLFTSCGLDSKLLDDIDLASLTSSTTDDPIQELADLRRQVVYLQGQVDDRDRTIRLQKNLIEKLEAEKLKAPHAANEIATKECVDTATQTERTRPLTIGTESLSRSKPEYTSYTTYFPAICSDSTTIIQHHQQNPGCLANNQTRRHTIISTTLTNYNQQLSTPRQTPRRASIAWEKQTPSYKPVKITLIGDPLKHWQSEGNSLNKTKDEEFSKKFINTNLNKQQQQQQQLTQQENNHNRNNNNNNNNIILNSKHHHRLQDIMVANEKITQNHHHQQFSNNNHHHYHHQPQQHNHQPNQQMPPQQQQQQSHQFYKTTSHQHNNLKPTVTIV